MVGCQGDCQGDASVDNQQTERTSVSRTVPLTHPKGTAQDYVNARLNNPDSLLDTINSLERFR